MLAASDDPLADLLPATAPSAAEGGNAEEPSATAEPPVPPAPTTPAPLPPLLPSAPIPVDPVPAEEALLEPAASVAAAPDEDDRAAVIEEAVLGAGSQLAHVPEGSAASVPPPTPDDDDRSAAIEDVVLRRTTDASRTAGSTSLASTIEIIERAGTISDLQVRVAPCACFMFHVHVM